MTTFQSYMIVMASNFSNFFIFVTVLCILTMVIAFVAGTSYVGERTTKEEDRAVRKRCRKISYILIAISIPMLLLSYSFPRTNQLAAIIVIPKIVNNKQLQKLPDNVLDLANQWVDKLKPKENNISGEKE